MLLAGVAEHGGARLLLVPQPLGEFGAGPQATGRVWCCGSGEVPVLPEGEGSWQGCPHGRPCSQD